MNFTQIKSTIRGRNLSAKTECINGNLSVTGYDRDMNRIVIVNRHKIQVKGKLYSADANLEQALDHYRTRGIMR